MIKKIPGFGLLKRMFSVEHWLNSLEMRTVVWMALILFFILGLVSAMNVIAQKKVLLDLEKENAYVVADTILRAIDYPMLTGDQDEIQMIFDRINEKNTAEKDKLLIHLVDANGTIKRSTDRSLIGQRSMAAHLDEVLSGKEYVGVEVRKRNGNSKVFARTIPFINEHRCYRCHGTKQRVLGALRVAVDWAPFERAVTNARNRNVLLAVVGLIFVCIFSVIYLMITIIGPLKQLEKAMNKVAQGDFSLNLKTDRDDEIGTLGKIFNKMTQDLRDLMQRQKVLSALEQRKAEELSLLNSELQREVINRTKAEARVKEAAETKSRFTSMVSHELRTPLTAIKEGINIVLDGSAGDVNEEQKDFLSTAKRNVDRLSRLINDVLDFQKLEAGKLQFNLAENDLNEVAREVHQTMEPVVREKNLALLLDLDENMPKLVFDRDRITQVITNLLNNAMKFTEQGSITIATTIRGNIATLNVIDTGIGIKQEDLPKLFQSFEQVGKDRKTGGTGLGLAISKEIIAQHKGRIWVESEFGKGTTFGFLLPVVEHRA
jgi:signal transduction histidine kinase